MLIKQCIVCGDEFDLYSEAKKRAGGRINVCPEDSEETTVKYAGVQSADGKQAQATILKFNSEKDKQQYLAFWQATSGLHKGKSCQLSKNAPTDPGVNFKTIVAHKPTNHKGKMD